MMGIVVELALRPNRYFCLPIAWHVYEQGQRAHWVILAA